MFAWNVVPTHQLDDEKSNLETLTLASGESKTSVTNLC